jgi:hypothetical protein
MKQSKFLREDRLVQQAIDVLMEKLGPVETTRFLSLPAKKRIDSVKRHRIWQSKLEKESFFNDVFGS